MAIGALIPLAVFTVIAGSVGFRLIRLWRETRELPEMSLGCGLAVLALGMPFAASGRIPSIALEPLGRLLFCAGLTANIVGVCMMIAFTYLVFRRYVAWARAMLAAMCVVDALALGYICAMNLTGSSVEEIKTLMKPGTVTLIATMLVAFVWSALESFRVRSALRRQRALGLGDPVVANRFLLWGVGSVTSAMLMGVMLWCVLEGMTIMRESLPLSVMSASGAIMSASWYLTFFAPAAYQRFIRERSAQNS